MKGIIDSVEEAFNAYEAETLLSAYGVLYGVYNEILKSGGDNNFRQKHGNVRNNIANGDFDACREVCLNRRDIRDLRRVVERFFTADN